MTARSSLEDQIIPPPPCLGSDYVRSVAPRSRSASDDFFLVRVLRKYPNTLTWCRLKYRWSNTNCNLKYKNICIECNENHRCSSVVFAATNNVLWMAMRQQRLIFSGGLSHESVNIARRIIEHGAAPREQPAGRVCILKRQESIALSTTTTSSEFKTRIQPIMDGYAPTVVNIWWGSIVLFHMSPWNELHLSRRTTNAGCALTRRQWPTWTIEKGTV